MGRHCSMQHAAAAGLRQAGCGASAAGWMARLLPPPAPHLHLRRRSRRRAVAAVHGPAPVCQLCLAAVAQVAQARLLPQLCCHGRLALREQQSPREAQGSIQHLPSDGIVHALQQLLQHLLLAGRQGGHSRVDGARRRARLPPAGAAGGGHRRAHPLHQAHRRPACSTCGMSSRRRGGRSAQESVGPPSRLRASQRLLARAQRPMQEQEHPGEAYKAQTRENQPSHLPVCPAVRCSNLAVHNLCVSIFCRRIRACLAAPSAKKEKPA